MVEWSVLLKASGPEGTAPLARSRLDQFLGLLPGNDKSALYPGASGRGHGLEVRFWVEAPDAVSAAARGHDATLAALRGADLASWPLVRLHVASADARTLEIHPAVDEEGQSGSWSVMVRAVGPEGADVPTDALLARLPVGAKSLTVRGPAYDARFWIGAADGANAAVAARDAMHAAHEELGMHAWRFVHIHAASREERLREHFPGVARRVRRIGPSSEPPRSPGPRSASRG